jgi:alkaline phosphatase D
LYSQAGDFVGVELATSSVSSPGIEKYLNIPVEQLQQFEMAFTTLIDELDYTNLNQRGYLNVSFTATQVQADWIYVDTIKEPQYTVDTKRGHQVVLNNQLVNARSIKKTA